VVVEVEFNGTNKTTLRSEWGSAPKKRKKMKKRGRKNSKKNLTKPTLLEITGFAIWTSDRELALIGD